MLAYHKYSRSTRVMGLWLAQTADLDWPHPNARQEKFYWCTVTPTLVA